MKGLCNRYESITLQLDISAWGCYYTGRGRLAQLVERLAYTEVVGGSSPSSPTRVEV
jgi:hypothetical protein